MLERVSICIPTYNRQRLLFRAIKSCLSQTYPNIEILISDNASSDATQNLCADLLKLYSFIVYFRQPFNIGPQANIEFLSTKASGEYIIVLADDDYLEPCAIEKMLDMFAEDSSLAHVGCHYNEINANGATRLLHSFKDLVDARNTLFISAISDYAVNQRLAILVYGLTRRKVFLSVPKKLRFYKLDFTWTMSSTELIILRSIALRGGIGIVPQVLLNYSGPGDRDGQPSLADALSRDQSFVNSVLIEIQRYGKLCWMNFVDKTLHYRGIKENFLLTQSFIRYVRTRFAVHFARIFGTQKN